MRMLQRTGKGNVRVIRSCGCECDVNTVACVGGWSGHMGQRDGEENEKDSLFDRGRGTALRSERQHTVD